MFAPYAHWHCATWNPWASYHYYYPHSQYVGPAVRHAPSTCCPACGLPYQLCSCTGKHKVLLPQEVVLDPPEEGEAVRVVIVGGECDANLTLEYIPVEGADPTEIALAVTDAGATTTWEESSIAEGYHVKSDFPTVSPGAKIELKATGTMARLRWCEIMGY